MRKINAICYNWFYGKEGEDYDYAKAGKYDVIKIEGHISQWAGDRSYYEIFYKDGMIKRVFNVNSVDMENVGAE